MTAGIKTIIYPVSDMAQAKALFGAWLESEPETDTPYYVGFKVDDQQIGLDPNGHANGLTGPVGYLHVDDIRDRLQRLLDAGAQPKQEITDVGGGRLIASVSDADGNIVGLLQDA
jgi:predicted enzyme related to lactoylglutathione lyase